MSYRSFKKLLGESSLERKCRFLLGAGSLLLITASFWGYARLTENIAYDASTANGRFIVPQVVMGYHVDQPQIREALREFSGRSEQFWDKAHSSYTYVLYKPNARNVVNRPEHDEISIVERFMNDADANEEIRVPRAGGEDAYYYGAIRPSALCLKCHHPDVGDDLKPGGLMGVVRIKFSSASIEEKVHLNRALLITSALLTSLLIMAGSYLIVRYVIVKPVKHLKEVSDAVAAGELNVRSEIQTGDEFEDLSYAFNRMLRNLVAMQDRLKQTNGDLDGKVDELARANMALYESNRIKSDFLATMSHELRTPLNSVLGFSDVLLSSSGLTEKQQRWINNIRSSGGQLLNLINDILDLAKIEAGKMDVRPTLFAFAELAERQANLVRPQAEKKTIDLRVDFAPGLPELKQDAGKLQQILANLLSNAIKFTPEGGLVTLRAGVEGAELVFTVVDTGVGIAPEDQELIFEKFRQAANPMTREQEGTGLGLSIVRELAKLLGGDVSLVSEVGRGSAFTVRLPLRLN